MRVRRAPCVDAYTEEDESVILLATGSVVALSPLATAVVALLSDGALESGVLAVRLVEMFGAPPGDSAGATVTDDVLLTLAELGVVVLDGC